MPDSSMPVFIPDLRQTLQLPEEGIASRILQNDEHLKVILYGFAAGHAMSLHAAPVPSAADGASSIVPSFDEAGGTCLRK